MECQPSVYLSCEDGTTIFGIKTGNKVHLHVRDGETIRLDAYTITDKIAINLVDKNPGADCADCGTGAVMPYAPCGEPKALDTLNKVQYIRGPGVFELMSSAPPGVPYVKITKQKSVSDIEFCNQVKPACEDTTWTATEEIRCTGTVVEKKEISNCGNARWVAQGPQTWTATGATRCEGTNVEREEKNDCGTSRWVVKAPQVWTETGSTRCEGNVVQKQESNDCGTLRWTATTTTCGYCPSLRVSCTEPGFGFHEMDPKDPAATVELTSCAGDTTIDSIWIYPSAGPGHTIKVTECDGTLIGYAANQSDCAGDCGCK